MKSPHTSTEVVFFHTRLGWMGLAYSEVGIQKLAFGHETREDVATRFELERMQIVRANPTCRDWINELKSYARGDAYNFADFRLDLGRKTEFQLSVIKNCRKIPHGETRSYLELAKQAGYDGAARAVGTVMSKNNIPLVIPCHRVVSSSGLGGFSAPRGLGTKRQLLELEGNHQFPPTQKELAL